MKVYKKKSLYDFNPQKIKNAILQAYNQIGLPDFNKVESITEDIVNELEALGYKAYSVNYISTIWKQHISKRIAQQSYLWWNEREYRPDGTLRTMFKWKICPECNRQLFADPLNFNCYIDGTYKDICKSCMNKKNKKNKKKEKKNA